MDFTLKITMNKKPGKKGKSLLYLQAFVNGERSRNSIEISIEPAFFDFGKGLVKEGHPNYNDLNIAIRNKISKANAIAGKYRIIEETSGQTLTKKIFEREFNDSGNKRGDFLAWYEKRLNYRIDKKIIEEKTTGKNERTTLNKLKEFRPKGIRFSDLTSEFMDEVNLWMIAKGNKQNTRWGLFKHLHAYLEEASSDSLIQIDPFEKLNVPSVDGPTVYLEKKEINKLIKYYEGKKIPENQKQVLKYFLFACFTGLRISDVKRISLTNVVNGSLVFLPKKGEKNGRIVSLPLNQMAKEFMKSFKTDLSDLIFDTVEDPVTNRILKKIASACKISKRVTFHVARHSFGTLYLEMGGKVQVLQKYMGHSKISTTMRYVHIVDKEKKVEMKRFDVAFKR